MDADDKIILRLRNAQVPYTVFGQTLLGFAKVFVAMQAAAANAVTAANAGAAATACKEMQKIIETQGFMNRSWCGQLHNYLITGSGADTACELVCKTMVLVGQQARIVTPRRWTHVDPVAVGSGYFVVPRINIEDEACDWWGFGEFLTEHSGRGGGIVLGSRSIELPAGIIHTLDRAIEYSKHFKVDGLPDRRATKREEVPGAVIARSRGKKHKDV